jgi:hypothetical protein
MKYQRFYFNNIQGKFSEQLMLLWKFIACWKVVDYFFVVH